MAAPIIREGSVLGSIGLVRTELRPFSQQEVALLESFADQAAIAIDNARLIRELRERNREVSDALERQTALADVLNVIASSATDAKPVLEAIIETGSRLCAADGASAHIIHGDRLRMEVARGYIASMVDDARSSWPVDDRSATGRAVQQRCTIVVNGQQELDQFSNSVALTVDYAINSLMAVPLLRGDRALGALAFLSAREEAFSAQQVALIETFADQAAIAIDNARLFSELQARNKEITDALRREEASSEILRQISEAPEELDATLQAITDAARRLTGTSVGDIAAGRRVQGLAWLFHDAGLVCRQPAWKAAAADRTIPPRRATSPAGLVESVRSVGSRCGAEGWLDAGVRAVAIIPIPRGDEVLGLLALMSTIDDAIAPPAIALLQSFADQAAIAIENARLIRELRESNQIVSENLDRQQVLGNVLSIIASAPADLDATLPQIAAAAQTALRSGHRVGQFRRRRDYAGVGRHPRRLDVSGRARWLRRTARLVRRRGRQRESRGRSGGSHRSVGRTISRCGRRPSRRRQDRTRGVGRAHAEPRGGDRRDPGHPQRSEAVLVAPQGNPRGARQPSASSRSRTHACSTNCKPRRRNSKSPRGTRASSSPTCRMSCAHR